jgi:hypothetical protein
MRVVVGRAGGLERDVPFGLVVDALDDEPARFGKPRLTGAGPRAFQLAPSSPPLGTRRNRLA